MDYFFESGSNYSIEPSFYPLPEQSKVYSETTTEPHSTLCTSNYEQTSADVYNPGEDYILIDDDFLIDAGLQSPFVKDSPSDFMGNDDEADLGEIVVTGYPGTGSGNGGGTSGGGPGNPNTDTSETGADTGDQNSPPCDSADQRAALLQEYNGHIADAQEHVNNTRDLESRLEILQNSNPEPGNYTEPGGLGFRAAMALLEIQIGQSVNAMNAAFIRAQEVLSRLAALRCN